MTQINVNIIADSITNRNHRITTFLLKVPQIVAKELLRHRMFSFNSSSMRAIPFKKVLERTKQDMFVPSLFQRHHSGMQGIEYLTGIKNEEARKQWVNSGLKACTEAEELHNKGVTKQICSRIIEPFGYANILVTATKWDNFFNLRCPKYNDGHTNYYSRKEFLDSLYIEKENYPVIDRDSEWIKYSNSGAEIHIQLLAEKMWDAMNESNPQQLEEGQWHIPFGDQFDKEKLIQLGFEDYKNGRTSPFYTKQIQNDKHEELKRKIAVARCARLSYETHDGEIDYEKDIKLHDRLLERKHASPFEHIAVCQNDSNWYANFKGWKSYRKNLEIYGNL